jgi:hypothetical protein
VRYKCKQMRRLHIPLFSIILLGLIGGATGASAKAKKAKPAPKDPQDQIEVVGHIPPIGGPVTRFMVTKQNSRYYLYVEHEGGKDVTLVDISKTAQPLVLSEFSYPSGGGSETLFAMAGTAALIIQGSPSSADRAVTPPTQTVRIMDLSDPEHPSVTREFTWRYSNEPR